MRALGWWRGGAALLLRPASHEHFPSFPFFPFFLFFLFFLFFPLATLRGSDDYVRSRVLPVHMKEELGQRAQQHAVARAQQAGELCVVRVRHQLGVNGVRRVRKRGRRHERVPRKPHRRVVLVVLL